MIDISLTKFALICAIALIIIGPKKLPAIARMAGSLIWRMQNYINEVKSEVSREIELEELRKIQQKAQEVASNIEQSLACSILGVRQSLHTHIVFDDIFDNSGANEAHSCYADQLAIKLKNFRKKKLACTSAIPIWYKQRGSQRVRLLSGAARFAKYRSAGQNKTSSAFF